MTIQHDSVWRVNVQSRNISVNTMPKSWRKLGGRALIARLAQTNIAFRIITRNRERHRNLLVFPQVQLVEVNPHEPATLSKYFLGSDVVINLSGILNEQGPNKFHTVHAILAQNVAEACAKSGVPRLLHMCALGATPEAPSAYLRSKAEGEHIVQ